VHTHTHTHIHTYANYFGMTRPECLGIVLTLGQCRECGFRDPIQHARIGGGGGWMASTIPIVITIPIASCSSSSRIGIVPTPTRSNCYTLEGAGRGETVLFLVVSYLVVVRGSFLVTRVLTTHGTLHHGIPIIQQTTASTRCSIGGTRSYR
jgi:hypothetical protein